MYSFLLIFLACLTSVNALNGKLKGVLTRDGGNAGDEFGGTLVGGATRLVIGEPGFNGGKGQVHEFPFGASAPKWADVLQTIAAPDGVAKFGSKLQMNAAETVLVVGGAEHVVVYLRGTVNDQWVWKQTVSVPAGVSSLAVNPDGDAFTVGSALADAGEGYATLYKQAQAGGLFAFDSKLLSGLQGTTFAPANLGTQNFGWSVSMTNRDILIGVPGANSIQNQTNSGGFSIHPYDLPQTGWEYYENYTYGIQRGAWSAEYPDQRFGAAAATHLSDSNDAIYLLTAPGFRFIGPDSGFIAGYYLANGSQAWEGITVIGYYFENYKLGQFLQFSADGQQLMCGSPLAKADDGLGLVSYRTGPKSFPIDEQVFLYPPQSGEALGSAMGMANDKQTVAVGASKADAGAGSVYFYKVDRSRTHYANSLIELFAGPDSSVVTEQNVLDVMADVPTGDLAKTGFSMLLSYVNADQDNAISKTELGTAVNKLTQAELDEFGAMLGAATNDLDGLFAAMDATADGSVTLADDGDSFLGKVEYSNCATAGKAAFRLFDTRDGSQAADDQVSAADLEASAAQANFFQEFVMLQANKVVSRADTDGDGAIGIPVESDQFVDQLSPGQMESLAMSAFKRRAMNGEVTDQEVSDSDAEAMLAYFTDTELDSYMQLLSDVQNPDLSPQQFRSAVSGGDNVVDEADVSRAMKRLGAAKVREIAKIMVESLDNDRNGKLNAFELGQAPIMATAGEINRNLDVVDGAGSNDQLPGDGDGDGFLSQQEIYNLLNSTDPDALVTGAKGAAFSQLDTNSDGRVSDKEAGIAMGKLSEDLQTKIAAKLGAQSTSGSDLVMAVTGGSEGMNRTEVEQSVENVGGDLLRSIGEETWSKLDRDNDNKLSRREALLTTSMVPAESAKQAMDQQVAQPGGPFAAVDKNGDKKIDEQEMELATAGLNTTGLQQSIRTGLFNKLDTNNDGVVAPWELDAGRQRLTDEEWDKVAQGVGAANNSVDAVWAVVISPTDKSPVDQATFDQYTVPDEVTKTLMRAGFRLLDTDNDGNLQPRDVGLVAVAAYSVAGPDQWDKTKGEVAEYVQNNDLPDPPGTSPDFGSGTTPDSGSGYTGTDNGSGYFNGTDHGSGYTGGDQGSGYTGGDQGSGYTGGDQGSGFQGDGDTTTDGALISMATKQHHHQTSMICFFLLITAATIVVAL